MKYSRPAAIILSVAMCSSMYVPWVNKTTNYLGHVFSGGGTVGINGTQIPGIGLYGLLIAVAAIILSAIKTDKAWITGFLAVVYSTCFALAYSGNSFNFSKGGFSSTSGLTPEYGLIVYLGCSWLLISVSIANQKFIGDFSPATILLSVIMLISIFLPWADIKTTYKVPRYNTVERYRMKGDAYLNSGRSSYDFEKSMPQPDAYIASKRAPGDETYGYESYEETILDGFTTETTVDQRAGIKIPGVKLYGLLIASLALTLACVRAGYSWTIGVISISYALYSENAWSITHNKFSEGGLSAFLSTNTQYGLWIFLFCGSMLIFTSIISLIPTNKVYKFNCSKCNTEINKYDKCCANCGVELDWEDEGKK